MLPVKGLRNRRTTVVGEDGGIASGKVEGAGISIADEDSCATFAFVEIQPLLSLQAVSQCQASFYLAILTVGCQCSSRRPFGSSTTNVAAIVFEMGKLVESIL
jgi:hypothetical protein